MHRWHCSRWQRNLARNTHCRSHSETGAELSAHKLIELLNDFLDRAAGWKGSTAFYSLLALGISITILFAAPMIPEGYLGGYGRDGFLTISLLLLAVGALDVCIRIVLGWIRR